VRISVITICYNAEGVIERCLQSVAEQTHADIEHIVIDGFSHDGTVDIVRRYPHVARLISEPDRGIYDAMNKGLDHVTGDYVLFLNADDRFASTTALAKAVVAITRDPGGDVYYGALEVRPLEGPPHVFRPPPPNEAPRFMVCGCLPHQSTLASPPVFAKTGRFDLRYRCHADYDWFLKILADRTIDVRSMDEVVGSFQMGGISSQLAARQPEVYAIQNSSPLYATPEWDRERILALQEAFLQERIEAERLRGELRSLRERAQVAQEPDEQRGYDTGRWPVAGNIRTAVGEVRDAVRSGLRGLRWWMSAWCVRNLPPGAISVLRRVRARGRGMRAPR
jgi:glycosyltransferase involved in cell wall biosynthesis